MKRISVIIPLYNKEHHIERTINSVLSQNYKNFEAIIIDDGSTDASVQKVIGFKDARIVLIRQANQGVSAARNRGILSASSDLIAFLDADDVWTPDFLETILNLVELYPQAGLYATAYNIVDTSGKERPAKIFALAEGSTHGLMPSFFKSGTLGDSPIWIGATCAPKRVLIESGLFPLKVQPGEDTYMWIKIALKYPIAFSSKVCALYYRDAQNRACLSYVPPSLELPYESLLREAMKVEKGRGRGTSIDEFLARAKYLNALSFFLANHPRQARQSLQHLKVRMPSLRLRIFLVWIMSYLPYALIKPLAKRIWDIKTMDFSHFSK